MGVGGVGARLIITSGGPLVVKRAVAPVHGGEKPRGSGGTTRRFGRTN